MALAEKDLIEYCAYIRDNGQPALTCAAFDDDWWPVGGAALRLELIRGGYVTEAEGKIALAARGRALLE